MSKRHQVASRDGIGPSLAQMPGHVLHVMYMYMTEGPLFNFIFVLSVAHACIQYLEHGAVWDNELENYSNVISSDRWQTMSIPRVAPNAVHTRACARS